MPSETNITIAIITYNRPHSLARTLNSLRALNPPTGATLRLLVVDNDKARSAEGVVKDATPQFTWNVDYIVEAERGIPHARNAAIEYARNADYIAFIDDDDEATPDWLKLLYNAAQTYNADVVAGIMKYHFPPEKQKLAALDIFANPPAKTGESLDSAWTCNVLFSTSIYQNNALRFDPDFNRTGGSDSHFFRIAKSNGVRIVMCREAVVRVNIPESRTTLYWLARRNLRIGATLTISDIKTSGKKIASHNAWAAVKSSASYVVRLSKGVWRGEVLAIHPVLVICFMIGRMIGLIGASPHEYR